MAVVTFEHTRSNLEKERMNFAFFLAAALHILLLFGIGFSVVKFKPAVHSIDVTLAREPHENQPDEANFIAQSNQLGSGESPDKEEVTTNTQALRNQQKITRQATAAPSPSSKQQKLLATTSTTTDATTSKTNREEQVATEPAQQNAQQQSSESLASLQARLDKVRQEYSKIPKVRRLTSVSTKAADEATYLFKWIQLVEQVGNQNYPEDARKRGIYGELQLAVSILPDGAVEKIDIIRSSGFRLLDQAAMRTVRLASPFPPFTETMRKYDKYEIIRTWQYIPGDLMTTEN